MHNVVLTLHFPSEFSNVLHDGIIAPNPQARVGKRANEVEAVKDKAVCRTDKSGATGLIKAPPPPSLFLL